jgi:hypothetical protein
MLTLRRLGEGSEEGSSDHLVELGSQTGGFDERGRPRRVPLSLLLATSPKPSSRLTLAEGLSKTARQRVGPSIYYVQELTVTGSPLLKRQGMPLPRRARQGESSHASSARLLSSVW